MEYRDWHKVIFELLRYLLLLYMVKFSYKFWVFLNVKIVEGWNFNVNEQFEPFPIIRIDGLSIIRNSNIKQLCNQYLRIVNMWLP